MATDVSRTLPIALLILRVTIAAFLLAWAFDKFMRPEHGAAVFEGFYFLAGMSQTVIYVAGALQLVIVLAFLAGVARTWTYGLVLAMHAVSTLSSWRQYIDPYEGANLLFFAAWPTLGACIALFLLRDEDRLFSLSGAKRPA